MSTENARDTHFFLAGWNGHMQNANATQLFQQATEKAPPQERPSAAEPPSRSDADTMARAETTARFLLGWKYGQMPTSPDTLLRQSARAKAQWAWNAACKLLRFIDGSAPAEVPAATSEPMGPAAPAAQAVEPAVVVPGQRVTVNAGALQMVVNALRRDAAEGKTARDEMADELLATVAPAPAAVAVPAPIAAGMKAAAELVQEQADLYIAEHADTDPDTGAVIWHHRDIGFDWHNGLEELAQKLLARAALAATPPAHTGIRFDFKQATELLGMFGGEPGEVSVLIGDGHSGHGLYAMWTADPEGTVYLGQTDDEAVPDTAPQAQDVQRDAELDERVLGEGSHADHQGTKCPITGRPYFMHLEHPERGLIPTYGGPFDSYTVPVPDGEATDPWHERELDCERYDHDGGYWIEGVETIPLRIIHDDVLDDLNAKAEDVARLDFILATRTHVETLMPSCRAYLTYPDGSTQDGSHPTPRDAIDAAIAASAAQGAS